MEVNITNSNDTETSDSTPSTSTSRGKPSTAPLWDMFKLKMMPNGTVSNTWVECLLCKKDVSRKNRTTTNMWAHLRVHHSKVFTSLIPTMSKSTSIQGKPSDSAISCNSDSVDVEVLRVDGDSDIEEYQYDNDNETDTSSSKQPVVRKRKFEGPLDRAFRSANPIKKNTPKWHKITDSVTNFLVKSMSPIRTVELESFKELLHVMEPGYQVPSRKYFSEEAIPKTYNNAVSKLKIEIQGTMKYFSLTTDAWSSAVNMNPYVSLTCHYINNDWKLVSRNLTTVFAPEDHTGENLAQLWKDTLALWSLREERLVSITTDNGSNMIAGVVKNKWFRVPCFGHVLHNAVNKAMLDDRIADARNFCKKITAVFSHSSKRRFRLRAIQAEQNIPIHCVKTDCSTRWNSTYAMMERIVEQQEAIRRVLADDKSTSSLLVDWWENMVTVEEITHALKDYALLTDCLSGEQHVTISAVAPLLRHISTLAESVDDVEEISAIEQHIKETIAEYMIPRFSEDNLTSFLAMCTTLDPRYKKFVENHDPALYEVVRKKLAEEANTISISTVSAEILSEPKSSKSASKTLEDILLTVTDGTANAQAVPSIEDELNSYFVFPMLPMKSDPLAWWGKNAHIYPHLSEVARRYLCTPSTSVPSERLFSKCGEIMSLKRNKLSPEKANMLVFLASNYNAA